MGKTRSFCRFKKSMSQIFKFSTSASGKLPTWQKVLGNLPSCDLSSKTKLRVHTKVWGDESSQSTVQRRYYHDKLLTNTELWYFMHFETQQLPKDSVIWLVLYSSKTDVSSAPRNEYVIQGSYFTRRFPSWPFKSAPAQGCTPATQQLRSTSDATKGICSETWQ